MRQLIIKDRNDSKKTTLLADSYSKSGIKKCKNYFASNSWATTVNVMDDHFHGHLEIARGRKLDIKANHEQEENKISKDDHAMISHSKLWVS